MKNPPRRPRILAVDDDPAILSLIGACLADFCHVVPALGGRKALTASYREDFDLAVLDFRMPDLEGDAVVRSLRSSRPELPILLVSGDPGLPELARDLGVEGWLAKPFVLAEFRRAVARTLEAAAALELFRGGDHYIRFFQGSHEPAASVAGFLSAGLRRREGVIAIVTPEHRSEVERLLRFRGLDPEEACRRGQLLWLDAEELVVEFVNPGGVHHPERLRNAAAGVIASMREAGFENIRVFGEGVDLLARQGRFDLAEDVEKTWNGIILQERLHVY